MRNFQNLTAKNFLNQKINKTKFLILKKQFTKNSGKMFGNETFTGEELEDIEKALKKRLGRNYLSTRPAMGGQHVVYIEGWKVVDIANDIFGFNGW